MANLRIYEEGLRWCYIFIRVLIANGPLMVRAPAAIVMQILIISLIKASEGAEGKKRVGLRGLHVLTHTWQGFSHWYQTGDLGLWGIWLLFERPVSCRRIWICHTLYLLSAESTKKEGSEPQFTRLLKNVLVPVYLIEIRIYFWSLGIHQCSYQYRYHIIILDISYKYSLYLVQCWSWYSVTAFQYNQLHSWQTMLCVVSSLSHRPHW